MQDSYRRHDYSPSRSYNSGKTRWLSNRRFVTMAVIVTLFFGSVGLLSSSGGGLSSRWQGKQEELSTAGEDGKTKPNATLARVESEWDALTVLNGPPTVRLKDNLREGQKYITTFLSAGWTNDVMTYINLIYVGVLTDRIPIIGPFVPSHLPHDVGTIPFDEVFDLPRLQEEMKMHVVQWSEVKQNTSEEYDGLGCWNTWEVSTPNDHKPRYSPVPDLLKLDLSYTKAPDHIRLFPDASNEPFLKFWGVASLAFPEAKSLYAGEPLESPHLGLKLPIDDQLMCYDYLYYASALVPMEYDHDFSPAWREVGQHLHWTPRLNDIADQYVRRTLGVADGEKTPTWIGIHIRRGDFANICTINLNETDLTKCFAPLSTIARRVDEVKAELLEKKGIVVDNVIMTSDEKDEEWWEDVRKLGWKTVDHSKTDETYGRWYPVLIDAVIQGGGVGFVGTDGSTMSIIARRRVETWRDGVARIVKWGNPAADEH
ncbi:hypothetical protein BKA70DRAFT_1089311 [Coprinopsis sp. MPI-PUGE-AT-0042]|nr:hypothetical protein BKA70DRAFT_1089311 [Coprinopsis sp. MPI-PUGE-AT-0042]